VPRFSPSRHAVHPRLPIPDLRTGSGLPRTAQSPPHRKAAPSRRLPTPSIQMCQSGAGCHRTGRGGVAPGDNGLWFADGNVTERNPRIFSLLSRFNEDPEIGGCVGAGG
jgi:hypothetical protein